MPLNKVQKEVDDWITQYTIGYWKPLEILARLTEETGELAREVNHRFGPKKKKATEDKKELGNEMADIIFTLCCLANSLDINMQEGFNKIMDNCYGRDRDRWERKKD